jgi:transketolase
MSLKTLDFKSTSTCTIRDMTNTVLEVPIATGKASAEYGYDDLRTLMSRQTGDEKHDAAATSTLDVLWVLYDKVLRVSPGTADDETRDRFYLSKGHGPMAYYAVLAAKGFLAADLLDRFGRFDSVLGQHPDRTLVPGVEISSGSLGHGLPLAVGTALGLRARRLPGRVWALIGDGELDEGSNHEAIAYAGRAGLDNLHVAVIDNASANLGWPGGIERRFTVEGWSAVRVNGRDHAALEAAFTTAHPRRPHVVVAEVERRDAPAVRR